MEVQQNALFIGIFASCVCEAVTSKRLFEGKKKIFTIFDNSLLCCTTAFFMFCVCVDIIDEVIERSIIQ